MSWDASLACDTCGCDNGRDWSVTHNTSPMIYAALTAQGFELPPSKWRSTGTVGWYEHLDGMSAEEGAEYLRLIVSGLEADPERFREMNPVNGWGDYDGLIKVLREMRDASIDACSARWAASG